MNYEGLVVSDPSVTTTLPIFNWFMEDAVYEDILANHRYDDFEGAAVVAWDGQVVDNSIMRIRGNTSRTREKVSWKVELPSGHELDMRPLMPYPLDEFAIQRNPDPLTDLGWNTVAGAGARSLTTFPVRSQRNGDFWSVGHVMETEDGTWRDAQGVSDWAIYKGEGGGLRTAATADELEARMESGCPGCLPEPWLKKKERKDEDYTDVWELTQVLDAPASPAQRAWMLENLNIPELVNYMSVNAVIRHSDSGWYNWFVARDTDGTGRWEMWHWDLDWIFTTPASDGKGEFLDADNNRMVRALMSYPDIAAMFHRRVRTLADEFLLPAGKFEAMWDSISEPYRAEWDLDRDIWGGYSPTGARNAFVAGLADRYAVIANNTGPGLRIPVSQAANASVQINSIERAAGPGASESVELFNPSTTDSVDISGWTIDAIGLTFQPGTVLLPGARVVVVSNDVAFRQSHPGETRLVVGEYSGSLGTDAVYLQLLDGARLVGEFTDGPPPPPDTEAPSMPAGLSSSAVSASGATVSWNASTDNRGVVGYEIARDGVLIPGTITGLSFTDTGLQPSTLYAYTVRALDAAGNPSAYSTPLDVTTADVSPVLFADDFTAAQGAPWRSEWASSTNAGTIDTQDGTGRLSVSNTSGSWVRTQLAGVGAVADSDLVFSYDWNSSAPRAYFSVWSRASGGWLNAYRPQNGYGLQIPPDSTSVALQRVVNGALTNLDISSSQAVGAGRQWIRLRVVDSTIQYRIWADGTSEPTTWNVTLNDTTVTAVGQTYVSLVRSGSAIEVKSVTIDDLKLTDGTDGPPPPDAEAPSVPAGLSSSAVTTTGATVSWNASTDNRGVVGYEIARDGVLIPGTITGLSFTDTGLQPSTLYAYTVRALDAAGNPSAYSTPLDVTTADVPPLAVPQSPTDLAVELGNGAVTVSWVAPVDTGGTALTGFTVTADPGGASCTACGWRHVVCRDRSDQGFDLHLRGGCGELGRCQRAGDDQRDGPDAAGCACDHLGGAGRRFARGDVGAVGV